MKTILICLLIAVTTTAYSQTDSARIEQLENTVYYLNEKNQNTNRVLSETAEEIRLAGKHALYSQFFGLASGLAFGQGFNLMIAGAAGGPVFFVIGVGFFVASVWHGVLHLIYIYKKIPETLEEAR